MLLDPHPGDTVIDLCAAPGGKTTFIAERLAGCGTVTAVEKYDTKRALIQRSCERLGIGNVTVLTGDARTVELPPADRVLADVPCSGLGTLRKKPDIKWKREPEDIARLAEIQAAILDNAARMVKPGGVLVYSTCTTEPEENGQLIDAFLAAHPEFLIEDASAFVNRSVVTERGWIETWPHRHHVDGSFAVRMRRSVGGPS
jgi:16S rRNA (cytosine967-C5)-methyltransferase